MMSKSRAGDLLVLHYEGLRTYLFHLLPKRNRKLYRLIDRDEIVDETLVKVYERVDLCPCENIASLRGWLKLQLFRTFIDKWRWYHQVKNGSGRVLSEFEAQLSLRNVPDKDLSPAERSELNDLAQYTEKKMRSLRGPGVEALNLLVKGHSAQEIAEKLNCPVGTVHSWISRQRKCLAAQLKEDVDL